MPKFILKRYSGAVSTINANTGANITAEACGFSYPNLYGVEYEPIAYAGFSGSNINTIALSYLDLHSDATNTLGIINLSGSKISTSTSGNIDVLFAPSYMIGTTEENAIFIKREYTYYSTTYSTRTYDPGEPFDVLAYKFNYSIPEGYIPFSITKFTTESTYFTFINIDPFETTPSSDLTDNTHPFVSVVNTSTSAKAPGRINVEIVFIREDMMYQDDPRKGLIIEYNRLSAFYAGGDHVVLKAYAALEYTTAYKTISGSCYGGCMHVLPSDLSSSIFPAWLEFYTEHYANSSQTTATKVYPTNIEIINGSEYINIIDADVCKFTIPEDWTNRQIKIRLTFS